MRLFTFPFFLCLCASGESGREGNKADDSTEGEVCFRGEMESESGEESEGEGGVNRRYSRKGGTKAVTKEMASRYR